ncbi:hypothetical protein JOD02_000860 [Caldicoprobacter guelmensis]|nr:hypothetical protein [Caldicoprobacter guelmensis]MBM7582023.1 hypothetical protein [Caldicoprobacter guelmensis]
MALIAAAKVSDTMREEPACVDKLKTHRPNDAITRAAKPGLKSQSAHLI